MKTNKMIYCVEEETWKKFEDVRDYISKKAEKRCTYPNVLDELLDWYMKKIQNEKK